MANPGSKTWSLGASRKSPTLNPNNFVSWRQQCNSHGQASEEWMKKNTKQTKKQQEKKRQQQQKRREEEEEATRKENRDY